MRHALALVQDKEAALSRSELDLTPCILEGIVRDSTCSLGVKRDLRDDSDRVTCFGWARARHTGPLMGIARTEKPQRVLHSGCWKIRDGCVACHKVPGDLAGAFHQPGHGGFAGHGRGASDAAKAF
jgi:hypothetical protein